MNGAMAISTLASSYVWIAWLIYGLVFREFSLFLPYWIGYAQVVIVISLVLASYARESFLDGNHVFVNILFFVILSLLFLPHSDTISHDMDVPTLFLKVTAFYVLYVLTQLHQNTKTTTTPIGGAYSNPNYWRYKSVCDAELKIVRSSWVLLAPKYLVIGAVIQLVPLLWEIWKHAKNGKFRSPPRDILPVTRPAPQSRERERERERERSDDRRELERVIVVDQGEEMMDRGPSEPALGTTTRSSISSKHQTANGDKEIPPPTFVHSTASTGNNNTSSSNTPLVDAVLRLSKRNRNDNPRREQQQLRTNKKKHGQ